MICHAHGLRVIFLCVTLLDNIPLSSPANLPWKNNIVQTVSVGSNFRWANTGYFHSVPFNQHLLNQYKSTDIFYVLTGDTQYWYACTEDNKNCLAETKCTVTPTSTYEQKQYCYRLQGEYANRVQQKSIYELNKLIRNVTRNNLAGLVLEGDLVMYGNQSEIDRLKEQWMNYWTFRVYPGLGNHDYQNNVNKCPDEDCVNRILKYFISYVENTLRYRLDYERTYDVVLRKEIYTGSLSYSWDECSNYVCFHFVQLNFYPYYTKTIDSSTTRWAIRPSLSWLENDLRKNYDKPVVINFHGVDYSISNVEKQEFISFLKHFQSVNILAILFAHFHERVGLKEVWCFNQGRTKIPLIYTGSVVANNYLLLQLSTDTKSIKSAYNIKAENDNDNSVYTVNIQQSCTQMY